MTSLPSARRAILQRICNTELRYCTAAYSIIRTVPIGQASEWPLLCMEAVFHILDGARRAYYVTDGNKLIALHFVDELRFSNRYKSTWCILRFRWDFNL